VTAYGSPAQLVVKNIVVANAVVTPRKYDSESLKVPIHILNPTLQFVTLHQGTKVAELNTVDSSMIGGNLQTESCMPLVTLEDTPPSMQELLW